MYFSETMTNHHHQQQQANYPTYTLHNQSDGYAYYAPNYTTTTVQQPPNLPPKVLNRQQPTLPPKIPLDNNNNKAPELPPKIKLEEHKTGVSIDGKHIHKIRFPISTFLYSIVRERRTTSNNDIT